MAYLSLRSVGLGKIDLGECAYNY